MTQPMPSRPPSGGVNQGGITNQTFTTEVGPNGQVVRGYRVSFRTGRGVNGSVFVAESDYMPQNVIATVRAAANALDEVHTASI